MAAAELAPNDAGRWVDFATFLARRGRVEESNKFFDKAAGVAGPKTIPKVWFARAEANIERKRNLAQAKDLLTRYLGASLTPDDPSKDEARRLLKKLP